MKRSHLAAWQKEQNHPKGLYYRTTTKTKKKDNNNNAVHLGSIWLNPHIWRCMSFPATSEITATQLVATQPLLADSVFLRWQRSGWKTLDTETGRTKIPNWFVISVLRISIQNFTLGLILLASRRMRWVTLPCAFEVFQGVWGNSKTNKPNDPAAVFLLEKSGSYFR